MTLREVGDHDADSNRERIQYKVNDVAEKLSVSRSTLYQWMATGVIGYHQVGKRRFITQRHIDEFLDQAETDSRKDRQSA